MATAPMLGTGATFTYTGFTARAMKITASGLYTREAIKTSYLGSTSSHTFIPGSLYDPGTIDIEFQIDTGVAYGTPATAAASNLVITYSTGTTITASAFCTGIDWDIPLEELQTGTIHFKLTGDITLDTTP